MHTITILTIVISHSLPNGGFHPPYKG